MSWGVATQNGVSVSLASIVSLSAGVTEFSPADLFLGGVQGAWYDPSDLTTLFQDSAGTTPVTAVEQPVGLMLDKSQGLVLGSELVTNGDFSGGTTTGWTALSGGVLSVVSGQMQVQNSATFGRAWQTITVTANQWYEIKVQAFAGTANATIRFGNSGAGSSNYVNATNTVGTFVWRIYATTTTIDATLYCESATLNATVFFDNISIKSLSGNHASQATAASRPVLKALYNILTGTATLATQSVTTRAASYTLSFSGAGTITLSGTGTGTFSAGTNTVTCTAGALTVTVSGTVTNADLRLSVDATGKMPAYQDVVTSTNYTTTGFFPYLSFDGTDDSLATAAINFSATNKMSVFAGVSKLSDAVAGSIVELTIGPTSFDGGFGVLGPQSAANNYGFVTRGTTAYGLRNALNFTAPITNVIAASFDNAAVPTTNQIIARINAISQTLQSGPATSPGNYANAPIYLGRRGGASLAFNGRIYSVIVAGKQSTAAEISNTETWVNVRTGAY